jgi:hypothetical protein
MSVLLTEEVCAGTDRRQDAPAFYQTLLATHSFDHAEAKLGPKFRVFLAERFFCMTFARHMRDHGIGKGAKRRVEELVTKAVDEVGRPTARPSVLYGIDSRVGSEPRGDLLPEVPRAS